MATEGVTPNGNRLPGKDIDPEASVEKHVKIGWALVGIAFSAGLLTFFLQRLGITIWPKEPQTVDYLRLAAFVVCCFNILLWMWFPLEDLQILRNWVRTRRVVFPCHTSEFFAILLATVLLLLLILASLVGPVWFAAAGAAVYAWDFIGYIIVRRKVQRAVVEARVLYDLLPQEESRILHKILDVIERHWCSAPTHHWLFNRQQLRRAFLACSFVLVGFLGAFGTMNNQDILRIAAYLAGTMLIIVAELSHAIWRQGRDKALTELRCELRELEYGQPVTNTTSPAGGLEPTN